MDLDYVHQTSLSIIITLPFAIWLGRDYPLSPYLRAFIINFLLKEMKPRELKVAPDELFAAEGVKDFLQWSLIRNLVKDWLRYVSWYWSVANSPDVCIGDFFKAPFYEPSYKRQELYRFGLMWRCYDMIAEKGVSWNPPCLPERLPNYLGCCSVDGKVILSWSSLLV